MRIVCLGGLLVGVNAGCGGGGGGDLDGGAADVTRDAPSSDASNPDARNPDGAAAAENWVPFVRGDFTRVYRPTGTRYLNDHTVLRDDAGLWHVWGITHDSQGMPFAERSFLHATAPSLEGPWTDQPDALTVNASEQTLWAPFVVRSAPTTWSMYYWGSTADSRVQRADSADLRTWVRDRRSAPGGRDPFVLRSAEGWLLYSVGVSTSARGQILVSSSPDLETWSEPRVALEDPVPSFGWGNLESPTVARYDGRWYLFLTRTSKSPIDYVRTVVFVSDDPARFTWDPITELHTHAAEVFTYDGRWYITAAGWTSSVGERWRGLSVARLGWARPKAP